MSLSFLCRKKPRRQKMLGVLQISQKGRSQILPSTNSRKKAPLSNSRKRGPPSNSRKRGPPSNSRKKAPSLMFGRLSWRS